MESFDELLESLEDTLVIDWNVKSHLNLYEVADRYGLLDSRQVARCWTTCEACPVCMT